ncbi:hypothetical protein [Flavisolibacter ginsengisoli]|jgi:hypothetical protein|uniref:Uncharacterized protein n=1 Tax=Flavisolibacter ginsengisoli DSM 18119 TaxID=1121884 RepID=A0A1M5E549_9BACT|nr:hypothetical protein [Flavisolibacter ginsengisoli]SHF74264.1 hypothetical protein SAMN02745131_03422 [Flavisolibacter ginsengisoli DSM 18119]
MEEIQLSQTRVLVNDRSVLKMKLFTESTHSLVETKVNEWLQHHSVTIAHIGQSQSEKGGKFLFTISLFYYP